MRFTITIDATLDDVTNAWLVAGSFCLIRPTTKREVIDTFKMQARQAALYNLGESARLGGNTTDDTREMVRNAIGEILPDLVGAEGGER